MLNRDELYESYCNDLYKYFGFEPEKLFIQVVKEAGEFKNMVEDFNRKLELAPDKEYLIDFEIDAIEGMMYRNTHEVAGILNFPEGNELVKFGFNTCLKNPNMIIQQVWNYIETNGALDIFWESTHQQFFNLPNFKLFNAVLKNQNQTRLCNLTLSEIRIEAMDYLIHGGDYAFYLSFLKDLKRNKESVLTPNSTTGSIVNNIYKQFNNGYENNTESLNDIIVTRALEKFKEVELNLLAQNFLDSNCKWIREQQELAALIYTLEEKRYFKSQGKNKRGVLKNAKQFFQARYQIDISSQFRPCRLDDKLPSLMKRFRFIVP